MVEQTRAGMTFYVVRIKAIAGRPA